jgi:hypothetical protein
MGVKLYAKCHKCGEENIVNIEPIQTNTICEITFVCSICGALNNVFFDPNNPDPENQEWLCLPPQGFEWVLPAGKIMPIVGDPIYVSAFGEHYRLDPEIAYQYMRRKRTEQKDSVMTNSASQGVEAHILPNSINIKKIGVLCDKCGNICELNV